MSRITVAPFPIRQVAVDSPELEAAVAVMNASLAEEWGALAQRITVADYRAEARYQHKDVRFYVVPLGDRPGAVGKLELCRCGCRTAAGLVRVLKAVEGYGIGQRLTRHLEEVSVAAGYTAMRCHTAARSYRDDRATRILTRLGYEQDSIEVRLDLVLEPGVALPAPTLPPGVDIVVARDELPEGDLAALTDLYNEAERLAAGADEPVVWRPEQLRSEQAGYRSAGREQCYAYARDRRTGAVWASTISEYRDGDPMLEQVGSFALPGAPGGHELLAAVVARSIGALRATYPRLPRCRAFLPADRTATIASLRRVGFADTAFYRGWVRSLA